MATNLFSLEGKNVVVMGGAGGMGSSVARGLCEYGGNIALCDIAAHSRRKRLSS
jgi:NAD(P)-dependent dehydrogenase (short-subunit alcohol dehydrogenase family)